jgi:putative oxidoreductase
MMQTPLARFAEPAYAIMRIVVGLLFAFHGAQKVFGAFGGTARPLASLMGVAGVIELAAGLLVMFGLLAGVAAFVASGQMAFAYFLRHAPRGGWPIENDGELAALFSFVFLFISARGAGIWSLDRAWLRRHQPMPAAPIDGLSRA